MTAPPPAAEPWTTRRLLAWMSEAFAKAGLESARLQAEMLLAHVIGCQRLRLFMEPERRATDAERARLRDLAARALRHEPIDYLVGERSFFGLMFGVDRRVLVPRPSTETIVEFVLQEARRHQDLPGTEGAGPTAAGGDPTTADEGARPGSPPPGERRFEPETARARAAPGEVVFDLHDREASSALSAFRPSAEDVDEDEDEASLDRPRPEPRLREEGPARSGSAAPGRASGPELRRTPVEKRARARGPAWRIADVCTGSGCIAVALAHHLPAARVVATDISGDALEVARGNVERHGVGGRVELLRGDLLDPLGGRGPLDVIVSNPPYIPDDEWEAVPPNVKDHEPTLALRGGPDGLLLIRPLIERAPALLRPGGLLVIELAASRAGEALALAVAAPMLDSARILRDVDGLERVLVARRR